MTAFRHIVRVTFGRGGDPATLSQVVSFDLVNDMLEVADPFSLHLPFRRELWEAARPDTEIQLFVDDSRVLSGLIDDREKSTSKDGSTIEITGRDRGGRLVDESAPLLTFQGITVLELAQQLVGDWFEEVVISNAENRDLVRGPSRRKARVSSEPPISTEKTDKKVEPGESRRQVLQHFLEKAGLLGWSSADGRQFIIGRPNYKQEPQWRFFQAAPDGGRTSQTNVMRWRYRGSVGERYSEIVACGASKGDGTNYGPNVTKRRGVAVNGPGERGTGLDFAFPKRLTVPDSDVRSAKEAQERAEREMAIRDMRAEELELTVAGWGQALAGRGTPAVFAFDTIAHCEDEEAGTAGDFLITQVRFRESKEGGQVTDLKLVPRGTELRS